jgi:hypothetical protein
VDRSKLEPIPYLFHGFLGLLCALLFVPYVGVFWFAGIMHWWPVIIIIATVATVSGFFFRPTAILSLLVLLMLPSMLSGTIAGFAIAGYGLAVIVIICYWRLAKRIPGQH